MKSEIPTGPDLPPFWKLPTFELANEDVGAFGHVTLTTTIIKNSETWHAYAVMVGVDDRFEADFPTAQQAIDAVNQWYQAQPSGDAP